MSGAVTFFVPGRPFSKKRPRFGRGRTYTDPETVAAEQAVRWYAKRAFGGQSPLVGAVRLSCAFVFARAARSKAEAGAPHVFRPDGDNLLKLVLDALNWHAEWCGAWADDCQVAEIRVTKMWADDDHPEGTTVTVAPL